MSQMERNKGKLTPTEVTEEYAKECILAKGEELQDYYENYLEQFSDDPSWYVDNLVRVGSKWYKVEFQIEGGDLDFFADVKEDADGVIQFDTYHYNGGGHWTEVVEEALRWAMTK